MRPRQQVPFHPADRLGNRLHHFIVGRIELLKQLRIISSRLRSPIAHRVLKEADRTGPHADRQVGELLGRIVHIRPQCLKHRGSRFQPRDDRPQPGHRRSKVALHQSVDRPRRTADIEHRVVPPCLQRDEVQQLPLELAVKHLGIDRLVLAERPGPQLVQPGEKRLGNLDPFLHRLGRPVLQPIVILMQPGPCPPRRPGLEGGVEIIVHKDGKRRWPVCSESTCIAL